MVAINECTPQGCGSAVQYLLTDHLGSTVAVTNQSGTLTSQQRYLPFGEERAIPNSPILATDFGYTGQRLLDSGMGGIMDYKARFYSSGLGRFIQPDSIIPNPANPQDHNRFSYVLNNPVQFNDPSGHSVDCAIGEQYCQAGKLNVKKRANDLYLDRRFRDKMNGTTTQWQQLTAKERSILSEGGWSEKKHEAAQQLDFCLEHMNYPECDIPEQATLSPLPTHFTLIFPWQLSHLDAGGVTGDLTGCFIIICGTLGVSWIYNPKWGESTVFFNYGGGGGLGWGTAGSGGIILAYDAPYNSDLAGLATNYGANVFVGQGGQITYAHSASPNVTGNYAQTYTASYGFGGEASAHGYITNSISLITCIWGKNCK